MRLNNDTGLRAASGFGFFLIVLFFAVFSHGPGWCGSPAPPADGAICKVAAIYALTGNAKVDNSSEIAGIREAAEQINSNGGVMGLRFEVIELDNLSMAIGAKNAAETADQLGACAIIGPSWSTHALAAAKVAQRRKIPMIASMSTHPNVTRTGNYIFRVCYTDRFQGRVMAAFARKSLGASTASMLVDSTSDFSMGLADYFAQNFKAMGGRIYKRVLYKPHNRLNAESLVVDVKQDSPEVIFIPGHGESGFLARECQKEKPFIPVLGGDGWGVGTFYRVGGSYIKLGYYCTHWAPEVEFPASRDFILEYDGKFKLNGAFVMGYDATMLLADAIRRAGSTDREAIRLALETTKDYPGVTGPISFDKNGDPSKNAVIMEIRNGSAIYLKTVSPRED